ncbi:MAG: TPM domain-containing protein, partial [Candidatus Omnitrophica bacterium]|nr:TPM domain-containing protein [Candidatus Omnitrophota bacterium]
MVKKAVILLFLGILSLASSISGALDIPEAPSGYITDNAGLLDAATRYSLNNKLREYEEKTSNQIFVATFPSLEGESLEDFSIRLAEKWKAGQKGKDNGLIVLIFRDDRKIRIEVGYGLEGVLPDALAGQIIRNIMAPYFAKGNYKEGIISGLSVIIGAIQGEYSSGGRRVTPRRAAVDIAQVLVFVLFLMFPLVVITTVIDVFR